MAIGRRMVCSIIGDDILASEPASLVRWRQSDVTTFKKSSVTDCRGFMNAGCLSSIANRAFDLIIGEDLDFYFCEIVRKTVALNMFDKIDSVYLCCDLVKDHACD